ncbi:MAG TPA: dTMP kinase [Candidatus Acidoferrum sp.]|nr:dTMP kinase [Candidatus Acidoferrum sp.]
MTSPGKLIVFEGPDGVGKSTLVESCTEVFKQRGLSFLALSFPGKDAGTLGWLVDQIQHRQRGQEIFGLSELSLQALHIAAHLDHIETRIHPALRRGTHVVLDRFWWSTWVYGRAANVQTEVLDRLIDAERTAWVPTPAQVLLVNRTTPFRAEHDQERHSRLSALYTELASRERTLYAVTTISNDSIEESLQSLREKLDELF